MAKHKDPNYVAKLEKAIKDKYGEAAIENPRKYWNDEKEDAHQEQIKKLYEKETKSRSNEEKIEQDGFLIPKKLFNREVLKRTCPICEIYSFSPKDDLYMNKFECCFKCYINWVEGREERWETGWRPNNGDNTRNN